MRLFQVPITRWSWGENEAWAIAIGAPIGGLVVIVGVCVAVICLVKQRCSRRSHSIQLGDGDSFSDANSETNQRCDSENLKILNLLILICICICSFHSSLVQPI